MNDWTAIGIGSAFVIFLVLGIVNLRRAWTEVQRRSPQTIGADKPDPNLAPREGSPGSRGAKVTDNAPRVSDFRWVVVYCVIIIATFWCSRGLDPITEFRERAIFEGLGLGFAALGEFLAAAWRWPKEGPRAFRGLALLLGFSSFSLGRGVVAWFASPAMSFHSFVKSEIAVALSVAIAGVAMCILWRSERSKPVGDVGP